MPHCPVVSAVATVFLKALIPEDVRFALNGLDLICACVLRDLSLVCPVVVQSVKTGQTLVKASAAVVLPH